MRRELQQAKASLELCRIAATARDEEITHQRNLRIEAEDVAEKAIDLLKRVEVTGALCQPNFSELDSEIEIFLKSLGRKS